MSLQYVNQIRTMVNQNDKVVDILGLQQEMALKSVKHGKLRSEKAAAAAASDKAKDKKET